jgi:hypothetical protein
MQQSEISSTSVPWRDLRQMNVGETKVYPISRTGVIRTMCARAGMEQEKQFSTSTNRTDRTISVTRTR